MTSESPENPDSDALADEYDAADEQFASKFTVTDRGILIDRPEHEDTSIEVRPADVPFHGTAAIDFYYGRPVLYMFEPGEEEPQYMIAFPVEWDPQIRTMKTPARHFEGVAAKVKNGEY